MFICVLKLNLFISRGRTKVSVPIGRIDCQGRLAGWPDAKESILCWIFEEIFLKIFHCILVNLCKYSAILHCIFQANLHYTLWLPQNLKTMLTQSEPQLFSLQYIVCTCERVSCQTKGEMILKRNWIILEYFFFYICSKSKWFRLYIVGDDCVDSFGECGRYGYEYEYEYISHYNAI